MINRKFLYSVSAMLIASASVFGQGTMTDVATTPAPADNVNSNWQPSMETDGVIDRVQHVGRAIDLPKIRENDAAFEYTVWRTIDIRQKQNMAFRYDGDEYSGGGAFIELLINGAKTGKFPVYTSDRFTATLNDQALIDATSGGESFYQDVDPVTQEPITKSVKVAFNPKDITKFNVMEKWIFDRNAGRLVNRIIGICPVKDKYDENGNFQVSVPLFWVYYPKARAELANYEVYNAQNNLHRMTWTDYIDGRYFSSYVTKTSANNPMNASFTKGIRGLEAGQDAFNAIINKAESMWQQ